MNEFTKEKLEKFDKQLQEIRNQLEYLEDSLTELKDTSKISSEVDDFWYKLLLADIYIFCNKPDRYGNVNANDVLHKIEGKINGNSLG